MANNLIHYFNNQTILDNFEDREYSLSLLIPRIFCKHCDGCFGLTAQDLRGSWGMLGETKELEEDDKATEAWLLEHLKDKHSIT